MAKKLQLCTNKQHNDTPYTYTQKEAHGLPGHHGSHVKDLEEIYQRAGEIDKGGDRDVDFAKIRFFFSLFTRQYTFSSHSGFFSTKFSLPLQATNHFWTNLIEMKL